MKMKKLMLVALVLLAILTIGAASAADDVASDDLAVEEGDVIDVSQDDDVLSEGESPDDGTGDEDDFSDDESDENDGNDEGGDEDPYIEVPEEFDINDSDAVVVSLYCPHETNGVFYIDGDVAYYDDEGDEQTIEFDPLIHVISEDDWGKTINWTVSDLSVKMVGNYWFNVHLLESSDDEATEDNSICDGSGDAVDYTQFRAKVFEHDEFALTNNNAIVSVYCPEGSSGTVTVYVRKGDDDAIQYSKEVSQNVDNWLNWNIHDLGMDSMDEYFISVEANDNIIKKDVRIEIVNPIYFNQDISYIGSDFDRLNILEVEVSSEITEGRIIITYNGEEIFNKTLADFSNVESTSDLIWFNPRHGPGPGDETIKIYQINSNNVDYEFEEGTYEFTATLIYGSSEPIENTGSVTFAKINIATEGDYSIAIYDAEDYDLDDDWARVVEITAPEGADGVVKITEDNGWTHEYDLADLAEEEEEGFYVIRPYQFEGLDSGEYEITIGYYENDELVIENSATLKFYRNDYEEPDIFIAYSDWESGIADYFLNSDDLVHIYPNGDNISSVRIVVTIDGEEFLNNYIEDLGLRLKFNDEGNEYYTVGPANFNRALKLGEHYENVVAYYYSDEFEKNTINGDDNPGFFDIVGAVDEIDIADTESTVIAVLNHWDDGEIQILFFKDEVEDFVYEIQPEDKDQFILFNLGQLDLPLGDYDIEVQYNGDYLFNGRLLVVDRSVFYVKIDCGSLYDEGDVFSVYCPEGSEGTITISRQGMDPIEHEITDEDQGNYVGFTLEDLGIDKPGSYSINVEVDGAAIECDPLDVPSPMEFNSNGIAVIPDEGDEPDEVMKVVGLNIPYDVEGTVTITVDGETVFEKDLSDIHYEWDGSDYKYYIVYTSDLDEASEGEHTVVVTFDGITETRTISFNQRNIKKADGVSIEMFSSDIQKYNWDWNLYMAIITVPFDVDGNIKVLINDEEKEINWNNVRVDDVWDEGEIVAKKYYLNPNSAFDDGLEEGEYNVTVIFYDDDDNEIIRNNDTLNLFDNGDERQPDIFIMWSDWPDFTKVEYRTDSDDMIHIYPNGDDISTIRIIVKIGDDTYLDAVLAELNLQEQINDHDEHFYTIGPVHFTTPISPDHYDNVIAYYDSDNYHVTSADHDMPTYVDIIKGDDEPVEPVDPGLTISPIADVEEGVDVTVTVTANETFNGFVTVLVGENVVGAIDFGAGESSLVVGAGNFTVGENTVKVTSEAIGDFAAGECTVKFNVTEKVVPPTPVDPGLTISPIADVEEGVDVTVTVTANETFNGFVTVLVGENVVGAIDFGAGESSLVVGAGNFTVGENTVKVTSEAIGDFAAGEGTVKFNVTEKVVPPTPVEPVDPALTILIDNVIEGAPAVIKITTNDTFSGDVLVQIANGNYTVSVTNGTGSLPVAGLGVGTYNATAIFAATDVFKASEKNTTFTVAPKVATSIAAPAVTTTYATSKNIVVTLKDAKGNVLVGKDVTITLNGATKTIKTNDKGQASYAIGTKLVPKKYDVTIKFAGDSTYIASEAKVKVNVNKAKAKMTAKKKTFKAKKKSKKYSIVLKTDKNKALKKVKVTIKVKGKTYTAKTNSKGKATFNLKKLTKKGKHTATVKFKGNKYYNAVTKKVKITVKK